MSLARFGSAQDALFLHNHDLWFVIQHFVYRAPQRRRIGSEITHFVQQGDCRVWERRIAASEAANFPDELNNRIIGRGLVGSFAHGSMANAMPQAIGAQAAFPGRLVVSFCGDCGFAILMGDFITLVQQKLSVKIVIFNNGTLGFVELEMKVAGMLETGVELVNPDFAAMARAMGVFVRRVEDPGELEAAAREVLAHDGLALLDVLTNRQELSMPPKTDLVQVTGFSLYMMKAVMNGRGDEVIDLARTNLFR